MSFNCAPVMAASVVAVDVGKNKAALSVTSADRQRLFGPAEFAMTAPALAAVLQRVSLTPFEPVPELYLHPDHRRRARRRAVRSDLDV